MCAFTVSSVRALLMCAFAGGSRFFGRKYDALSSLSLAAVLTLLVAPARFFSMSFRLSYGAVAGLCIFSEPLSRGLRRTGIPGRFSQGLVSGVCVQLVTLPLMAETFGYVSVWGTLLNLLIIPVLPVLFLPLAACALLSLVFPFAAGVLLALPQGLLSAVLFLFSAADFHRRARGVLARGGRGRLACAQCAVMCKSAPVCRCAYGRVFCRRAPVRALRRLGERGLSGLSHRRLRLGQGSVRPRACGRYRSPSHRRRRVALRVRGFLARTYGGELDAVCAVTEDTVRAVNVAAFLPAACIYAPRFAETGLSETDIRFSQSFCVGELAFYYEEADSLTLTVQGCVTEFSFGGEERVFADLFVGAGGGRLKYRIKDGIIRSL